MVILYYIYRLQVILMSVDQGLSCAISFTSLDVSVALTIICLEILDIKVAYGKAKKSTAYVYI